MKYGDASLGQIEAAINVMGGMDGLQGLISGRLVVVPREQTQLVQSTQANRHVIDCDTPPKPKSTWKLHEHIRGGQFVWDPSRVKLHYTPSQLKGRTSGIIVREELEGLTLLNGCVLEYLIAHPELIPPDWVELCTSSRHGASVTFWGTMWEGGALGLHPFSLANSSDQAGSWYGGMSAYPYTKSYWDSPAAVLIA